MERDWLERELAAGRSIEAIARAVGRDPGTVAYWVNKHGLVSQHAAKHAARGGIERDVLVALVEEGLSCRAIAERLDVSYATVRHWLKRHDLATRRTQRRQTFPRPTPNGPALVEGTCEVHGSAMFARRGDGYYRCLACRSEAVVRRRRTVKRTLIDEAGGACALCGYDRSPAALHFHHVEPGEKVFALSRHGVTRALASARAEASKCVLLCANCHAEVEAGMAALEEVRTMRTERPSSG